MSDSEAAAIEQEDDDWQWAVVEIFGHRKHAGRTREVEQFGAKMLRIDIPNKGDPATHGWTTVFYGGSSIFSFGLSEEAMCLRLNKPYQAPSYALTGPEDESDDADI